MSGKLLRLSDLETTTVTGYGSLVGVPIELGSKEANRHMREHSKRPSNCRRDRTERNGGEPAGGAASCDYSTARGVRRRGGGLGPRRLRLVWNFGDVQGALILILNAHLTLAGAVTAPGAGRMRRSVRMFTHRRNASQDNVW
jgi:hypothetical protein